VRGYESNETAITALLKAIRGTQGLKSVEGEVRDLFRRPLMAQELEKFEAVVIDPPRQGAEAQARELARSKVERLVYVSCSAQTFARDARLLIDGGFRLERVTPYDQFRYSPHVELVGHFHR
jgi:23S rRNA (uracil1939-C5)-methyltransferase